MSALRTIIAQGRKRVGILVGAGAPAGMRDDNGKRPLIPAVAQLTEIILGKLDEEYREQIAGLKAASEKQDIETLLSRIRALSSVIGMTEVHGLTGEGYQKMAEAICQEIGEIVNVCLPSASSPYDELVSWINGSARDHPVEIFSTNYDLLFEEAFEKAHAPYFDGFSGSREAFFDPASVSDIKMSPRWSKLWKLHGSLGWKANKAGEVVRTGQGDATHLIFPEHLKYDQTQKAPYAALLDRLRTFLALEDTLLVSIGFSYADAHISARLSEALASNPSSSVFAFQFQNLEKETHAVDLAKKRSNFSVYARDRAVINGVSADWKTPDELPAKDWGPIRKSYWSAVSADAPKQFLLGDIEAFARFFANSRSPQRHEPAPELPAEIAEV